MRKTAVKNLPLYRFHLLEKFGDCVEHAVLSREGGVSKAPFDSLNVRFGIGDRLEDVAENRRIICRALTIEEDNLVSSEQTHGNTVLAEPDAILAKTGADKEKDSASGSTHLSDEAIAQREVYGVDAFVTDEPGTALMIQVADCQAQLMYDPVKNVVAAVHAGWKGLAQDISGEVIKVMRERFGCNPKDILVGIAPSLGPCCAFFSDPEKELPKSFHKFIDAEKRVDLWSFSLEQMHGHGIAPGHIELARICTQCNNGSDIESRGRFFSYRGEKGITGRFGVLVYLR